MARYVEHLSNEELREISKRSPQEVAILRSLYKEGTSFYTRERERLEAGLADFAQRGGALMAVAGLIALLPFPEFRDAAVIKHFFMWVYPFLAAAVIAFFAGSSRIHVKVTKFTFPGEGMTDELIALREEAAAMKRILDKLHEVYERTLEAHRYTSISVLVYLLAFGFHYGWYLFAGLPAWYVSAICTLILIWLGRRIYIVFYKEVYTDGWDVAEHQVEREIMLGGVGPPPPPMQKKATPKPRSK